MKLVFFLIMGLLILFFPAAQENSLNWDIDSIFDEPFPFDESSEDSGDSSKSSSSGDSSVLDEVMRPGLVFDASFEFVTGIFPGYPEVPWESKKDFAWKPGMKMVAGFGLDARISPVVRVKSTFNFLFPDFNFTLGDFFFDYNMYDVIFFRGGKYIHSWGVSPNFGFTDLLARVPSDGGGDSYLFRADIPLGIGGFQFLALTRADLKVSPEITRRDFGYGAKYNLAFTWADFNWGTYYKFGMPLRSFLSVKTTVGDTELYTEGLLAVDVDETDDYTGAVSFGFARDFFGDKIGVNGEFVYNAEKNSFWFRPESGVREAETPLAVDGINLAFNVFYRFGGKANPRLFFQSRYAPSQNSAMIVPGFRLKPLTHIEVYLAVPMSLGSKDGYYYGNTEEPNGRPFCVMLLVSLKGNISAEYYTK